MLLARIIDCSHPSSASPVTASEAVLDEEARATAVPMASADSQWAFNHEGDSDSCLESDEPSDHDQDEVQAQQDGTVAREGPRSTPGSTGTAGGHQGDPAVAPQLPPSGTPAAAKSVAAQFGLPASVMDLIQRLERMEHSAMLNIVHSLLLSLKCSNCQRTPKETRNSDLTCSCRLRSVDFESRSAGVLVCWGLNYQQFGCVMRPLS